MQNLILKWGYCLKPCYKAECCVQEVFLYSRSVSPARPSRSSEPNHVHTASRNKNLILKPQNTNIQKVS